MGDLSISQNMKEMDRFLAEGLHGTKKGRLFVQGFSAVGAESRGKVARSPPEGKLEASGSPFTSSLPEKSMITSPFSVGVMKLSCFSAVNPVMGWNQWVKWVAPFSTAHSFMATATELATSSSRWVPFSMVFFKAL